MISFQKVFLAFMLLIPSFHLQAEAKIVSVIAPNHQTKVEFTIGEDGQLQYRVYYFEQEAIKWSVLGLHTNHNALDEKVTIKAGKTTQVNDKFAWSLGENDTIVNHYNEMILSCTSSGTSFNIRVRVFNGSVAFRYEASPKTKISDQIIHKEYTTFNLSQPSIIYQYNQESIFTPTAIDTLSKTCDFPATLKSGKLYLSIGEAENDNYTKAELKKGVTKNSLEVAFVRDSIVQASGVFRSPWRTISISKTAIGLHAYSDLYLKLTDTSVKEVPGWIKPGKLIRSQLNTQSGFDCIDFAATHNLQYIMFDAGWYGAEFRSTSDPTQVIPQMNMPLIIQHAKEKGIGVILYVNYAGLRGKLDTILPLYKQWGVSGLKFGFVNGLTQEGITWLASAIKKATDYGFIIDIHDNYKPTGLSRKYPALLTQEGIRGDENCPDAFHTTVLPYTRFLAGPADFTFCYPNSKESFSKNIKVSKAQQLALTVVYFSPLQSIYWYGKPKDYTNEEEIEFFNEVPTVWDESHYLAGDIGKNISVARRKGDTWYIGSVAGLDNWEGTIRFDFLKATQNYVTTIYEDDGTGSIQKRIVNLKKGENLPFNIKAKGGPAMILRQIN